MVGLIFTPKEPTVEGNDVDTFKVALRISNFLQREVTKHNVIEVSLLWG